MGCAAWRGWSKRARRRWTAAGGWHEQGAHEAVPDDLGRAQREGPRGGPRPRRRRVRRARRDRPRNGEGGGLQGGAGGGGRGGGARPGAGGGSRPAREVRGSGPGATAARG